MLARYSSRLSSSLAGVVLTVVALVGCAGQPVDVQPDAAARLQAGVLTVTTATAAGDFAAAQSALATLQDELLAASASEQVSAARTARIQAAINVVEADLAAAIAASVPAPAEEPAPEPAPAPAPVDNGDGDKGDGDGDKGDGNGEGDGKDKGNGGKGNGKE